VKNLKQLHYCKEKGALAHFNKSSCEKCPWFEHGQCQGLNCYFPMKKKQKGITSILSAFLCIFIGLSIYFTGTSPEIHKQIMCLLSNDRFNPEIIKLFKTCNSHHLFKGIFNLVLGLLSIKSFLLLFQPEQAKQ
jgi:hypothetical protein